MNQEDLTKIIRIALKSPAGHNTQPWIFANENNTIFIKPDFKRSLHIADPQNRELYISLGCAAETVMIAARFYGYNTSIQISEKSIDCPIMIKFKKGEEIEKSELFSFVAQRQTTRNLFVNNPIPDMDIEILKKSVSEANVNFYFYTDKSEIEQFELFIKEANAIQMQDAAFKKELIQWMRFSQQEALKCGDGLYAACSGAPSLGRFLGTKLMKLVLNPRNEDKRLINQLINSSACVLITSANDNVEDRVKTGMALQRFALHATKLGINHSYLNAPCQIESVREKLRSSIKIENEFPQLLIRLGYSKKMTYSFRRRINDLLIRK